MSQLREFQTADVAGRGQPRFGSYIGLVFVVGIVSILSFALIHDFTGTSRAFAAVRPGMTQTEVAAALGVPQSETRLGSQLVETWRMPDGAIYEVTFQNGKVTKKDRLDAKKLAP